MFPLLGLSAVNLIMLYSLSKDDFSRQILFWVLGILIYIIARKVGSSQFFSFGLLWLIPIIIFLFLPILVGVISHGASRWINLGFTNIQPSEIVKPLLIGVLAFHLSKIQTYSTKRLLLYLAAISVPFLLVLVQPDLGSAAIIILSLLYVLWISMPKLSLWLKTLVLPLILLSIVGPRMLHSYQIDRIHTFLDPTSDPLGKGYNSIQAQMAIGSGFWWGRGLKQGVQTQLSFLPENHTDFIFSAIAEEFGFIGVIFTFGFYYWLFRIMINKITVTDQLAVYYFRSGIFILIFSQTAINIAMNLGIFPIVGITLPFVSYGGSSLLSLMLSLGLFFS